MSRPDFEPLAWAKKGIPRDEALRLWQEGFQLPAAADWRRRFGTDGAIAFRRAGVQSLATARGWSVAGVSPDQVEAWLAAGIGFAEAAAWHEFGYSFGEAQKLKAQGKSPSAAFRESVKQMPSLRVKSTRVGSAGSSWVSHISQRHSAMGAFIERFQGRNTRVIHGYIQRQWLDEEAVTWAEAGIDAADARAWKELGLAPNEAARLQEAGATPMGTMREWWQAGIPFEEVATWIGAGLSAAEAAAQRAAGVSADRAAILRALQDPAGPV